MLQPFFFFLSKTSKYRKIKCLIVFKIWGYICMCIVYELRCSQWAPSASVMTFQRVWEEDTTPEHSEPGVAKYDWHQSTLAWYFLCITPVPSPSWPCDCLLSSTAEADRCKATFGTKTAFRWSGLSYRENEYCWPALLIWPSWLMMHQGHRTITEW